MFSRSYPLDLISITPVLQVQELAATYKLFGLIYCINTSEVYSPAVVAGNLARLTPSYARESLEGGAFASLLERLDLAADTPIPGENSRKKADWPAELDNAFIALMNCCIADGNPAPRVMVRYIGQGPVRRGAAQATPQQRRRNASASPSGGSSSGGSLSPGSPSGGSNAGSSSAASSPAALAPVTPTPRRGRSAAQARGRGRGASYP
ncbi:hypothetical protein FLONG3_945 [Fusarium longipes]|uniref:Uncharacterized protein n=1 Tax=Fusarium longipes TaxID=694270 RepID=A0A395T869_9HYPO|nr:hypothetical protein FLONG3_945 [Fusarium longipes]